MTAVPVLSTYFYSSHHVTHLCTIVQLVYHAHNSLPLTCGVTYLNTVSSRGIPTKAIETLKHASQKKKRNPKEVESCAWFTTYMHRSPEALVALVAIEDASERLCFVSQVICRHHRGPHGRCQRCYESHSPNTPYGDGTSTKLQPQSFLIHQAPTHGLVAQPTKFFPQPY